MSRTWHVVYLLTCALVVRSASSQPVEVAKLLPQQGESGAEVGFAVAIDATTVVVGAPGLDDRAGAAHVFRLEPDGAWTHEATIRPSEPFRQTDFGRAVAVSDGTIMVGCADLWNLDDTTGAVFVFERTATGHWVETMKLTARNQRPYDRFGIALDIDGDLAVIGASGSHLVGNGYACVFRRHASGKWHEVATLTAPGESPRVHTGSSVAIHGKTVLIGDRHFDDVEQGDSCGAVHVFEPAGEDHWRFSITLIGSTSRSGHCFGWDIAFDGRILVGGAPFDDFAGVRSGSVYVLEKLGEDEWQEVGRIRPHDPEPQKMFGNCVEVSGKFVLISDPRKPDGKDSVGSVYVFQRVGERNVIFVSEVFALGATRQFGWSLATQHDRVIVGARGDREQGNYAGAAFVLEGLR